MTYIKSNGLSEDVRCENCVFFVEWTGSVPWLEDDSPNKIQTTTHCHRFPPHYDDEADDSYFQPVQSNDWCGEFYPKEKGQE